MEIVKSLLLGFVVSSDDDATFSWPVWVDSEDGTVDMHEDAVEEGRYVPVPQPAYMVMLHFDENDGPSECERLGYEIPGSAPIDWDARAREVVDREKAKWATITPFVPAAAEIDGAVVVTLPQGQ